MDLDNENPWEGILSATMFLIGSTVYITMQHTPSNWSLVGCNSQNQPGSQLAIN